MKFNKFCTLFAAICLLAPTLGYPVMPLINAIVRVTEWQKPGRPTIHLLGDQHNIVWARQEQEMIQALAQQKDGHVYVEDWLEHVGDNTNQNKVASFVSEQGKLGYWYTTLSGLVSKIRKTGGTASNVECRNRMRTSAPLGVPAKEVVEDYNNIVDGLKTISPKDPVDILSNKIIEGIEEREKPIFALLEKSDSPEKTEYLLHVFGDQTVDIIAFKKLCKDNDGFKHKSLVAGWGHCDCIGVLLEQVGYKNTRRLEGDSVADIRNLYKHLASSSSRRNNRPANKSLPAVSPEQIKEYFNNQNAYTANGKSWFRKISSVIIGRELDFAYCL